VNSPTASTLALHRSALVLDGLTPYYVLDEPYTEDLVKGGVKAIFLSVVSPQGWNETLERTETALAKIEASPLLALATRAEDIRRAAASGRIAVVLVTQAMDMLEKDARRVGVLYRLGYRVLGVCYTFANLLGCGCGELKDGGLTFYGKDVVAAVNELPIMLDVSHAGHQTSLEAVQLARAPCVTHANAHAVVANDRNKHDEVLKIIAAKGGIAGLNALPSTVRQPVPRDATLEDAMRQLDYLLGLMGEAHVGLGLDYVEGYKRAGKVAPQSVRNRTLRPDLFGSVDDYLNVKYPAGLSYITELPNLTQAMAERGYSEARMRGVLGENWVRAFERLVG